MSRSDRRRACLVRASDTKQALLALRSSVVAGDEVPGSAELALKHALAVLDAVVLDHTRRRRRFRKSFDLDSADVHNERALVNVGYLRRVDEAVPARAELHVDDDAIEDVLVLVDQHV